MTKLTESQLRAVESVDKNVLVAAGAGSGKTSVLVERAIQILRSSPEAKFSQVVAVTYTRKAASEMQTRLKQAVRHLASQANGQTNESERLNWSSHLAEIDTAKIGTIHSLCESILKSFAFDVGVDPQFEQLDDVARAHLREAAVQETLRVVIAEQTEEHELLLEYSLEQLSIWLNSVLSNPLRYFEAIANFIDIDKDRFKLRLEKLLQTVQLRVLKKLCSEPGFQNIRSTLEALSPTDSQTNIGDFRRQTLARIKEIENVLIHSPSPEQLSNCWKSLEALATDSIGNRGSKCDQTLQLKDVLKTARTLARNHFGDPKHKNRLSANVEDADLEIWRQTKLLMSLAQRTLTIYKKDKSTEGVDYDDLIALVSTSLSQTRSKIKDHYHQAVSHILVDEFQDTNLVQANLIRDLAGSNTKRFLIGDDKQSIYKFQGAEVALFNELRSDFQNASKGADENVSSNILPRELVIELSESFRSHPKIVSFFNAIFEKLFIDDTALAPYHAVYRPLAARAEPLQGDNSEHVEIIEYEDEQEQGSATIEAKLVANWIAEAPSSGKLIKEKDGTARTIAFGDVAVLVSKNDMFTEIEEALGAANIPFVRFGGQGFLERQEIYDMENLMDFMHNQNDNHALIGLLRSSFFALPDDLIHTLFTNALSASKPFWEVLAQSAKARRPGYEMVAKAYFILKRFVEESHFLTIAQLLRRFIQTTSYDITLLETRNGKQRSRNLWKLVQMASRREELSCGEFARHLRMMRELKVKEKDAPVDARNSVKLMTIHSSKGLEFPVVILPRLNSTKNKGGRKVLFHKDYGLALDNRRLIDQTPPLHYRLANWLEQDMETAEKRRLFYVAMTRARDYLTMLIPADSTSKDESFSGWLRKIAFREAADPDQRPHPSSRIASIPGTGATFQFKRLHGTESRANQIEPVTVGQFEQLSIFSHFDKPPQINSSQSQRRATVAVDYSLIEPVFSEAREPSNNALSAARITPRYGQVALNPILVGNYFHALLEHLPPGKKHCDKVFLRNIAALQGNSVAHKDILAGLVSEGKNLLLRFFDSELFEIIKTAIERHHELPYLMLFDDRIDTRRPDLLIRRVDRSWHVIDYKTDTFPLSEIEKQASQHRKQLENYALELSQLISDKVSSHLYFAQHGLLYQL